MVKESPPNLPFVEVWRRAVFASDLSPATKVCAFGLAIHMNGTGKDTRPGLARMVRETRLHRSTIIECRAELVDGGWLELITRGGAIAGGLRLASEYRAVLPPVASDDQSPLTTGSEKRPVVKTDQSPVARRPVASDDPDRSPQATPVRHRSKAQEEGGLKVLREKWVALLANPTPPFLEELNAKIDGLVRAYNSTAVLEAIDTLLTENRRFDFPSAAKSAIVGALPDAVPTPAPSSPHQLGCNRPGCEYGWIFVDDTGSGHTVRCECNPDPIAAAIRVTQTNGLQPTPNDLTDPPPDLPTKPPFGLRRAEQEPPPF